MHIPIPVPIGTKHVAAVQGAFWKVVPCEHCGTTFAYQMELDATGEDHDLLFLDAEGSAQRARARAEQHLLLKSRNIVVPVPCPSCGSYQADMAKRLKEEAWSNPLQYLGGLIVVVAFIPLAFDFAYNWVLTVVLAAAGLMVLAYGYMVAFRFDPNAGDPEPRKEVGRTLSVWGDRLAEITASPQAPEPAIPPLPDGEQPTGRDP